MTTLCRITLHVALGAEISLNCSRIPFVRNDSEQAWTMQTIEEAISAIGYRPADAPFESDQDIRQYLNLKLAAHGHPTFGRRDDYPMLRLGRSLLDHLRLRHRGEQSMLCPADQSIQEFLDDYLKDVAPADPVRWLPGDALVLERHGLARALSLPPDRDEFRSPILESYRVFQGVCHNPGEGSPNHGRRVPRRRGRLPGPGR